MNTISIMLNNIGTFLPSLLPEGVKIRRIESKDLSTVKMLADSRLNEDYSTDLFRFFFENHNGCFLVAEDSYAVIGFVIGIPLDARTLRIVMLAVDDRISGMGLGSSLMDASREYAKDRMMTSIVLEVRAKNDMAFEFYSKRGFKVTGMIPNYYNDKSDAFVMKRFLEM